MSDLQTTSPIPVTLTFFVRNKASTQQIYNLWKATQEEELRLLDAWLEYKWLEHVSEDDERKEDFALKAHYIKKGAELGIQSRKK